MSKWILLLLNDDVTLNFLNSIMENHRNLDFLNLVDKNKEIAILLYNYVKKIEPSAPPNPSEIESESCAAALM